MKMRSVKYLIGEGLSNIWVNRLMSLASIGVLVACMVVIGLAILISENATKALGNLEQQNVVMVYMKDYNWALYADKETEETESQESTESSSSEAAGDEATSENEENAEEADKNGIKPSDYVIHNDEEAKALCDKIKALANVEDAVFISSDEGLETVKSNMLEGQEEYFTFLDDEYGNPLSAAAKVTMTDMAFFDDTIKEIQKLEGVDVVQSQGDLADTINSLKKGLAVAGVWIIAMLLVIALVIVSNTIRVTMYNRKLEISIMKAVGATDSFIRVPFVVEGVVIGLVSALLSEAILFICYRVATENILTSLKGADIVKFGDVAWMLLIVFVAIGILAGAVGSLIMIGKYLRKEGSEFAAI